MDAKRKLICTVLGEILLSDQHPIDEAEELFSSDSSDGEYFPQRKKRISIPNYFEEIVPQYSDVEFIRHFRINRELFESIAERFKESAEYASLQTAIAYSAEKHLAIFLWFTGHEACAFTDLSDRFNVSTSTVSLVIKRVTYFLSGLSNIGIKWPNDQEKKESEEVFKTNHGFPGIIGAIDGTHIIIDPPRRSRNDYLDRKTNFSICLQGVCNQDRKFIDIFVGYPGSVHDSRVFKNSFIYGKMDNLCKEYHILGDSAYPCSQHVLTPYRDNGHLTPAQLNFNKCLSSSRVLIEHTFGILKQRFRQLYYCKLRGVEKLCHFIRACCVLHNLADEEDLANFEEEVIVEEEEVLAIDSNEDSAAGKAKRDRICRQLYAQRQ